MFVGRMAMATQMIAAIAAAIILLTGCAGTSVEDPPVVPQASSLVTDDTGYKLKAGDQLKVIVFGQDFISGDYAVGDNGSISLPKIGSVGAAGLTVPGLETTISNELKANGGVENPQVSVLLDAGRPVFVIGEVQSPGEFSFKPGLNAGSAVALAGGYTARADVKRVFLTKAGATGEKAYPIAELPVIGPGDVVRVPGR